MKNRRKRVVFFLIIALLFWLSGEVYRLWNGEEKKTLDNISIGTYFFKQGHIFSENCFRTDKEKKESVQLVKETENSDVALEAPSTFPDRRKIRVLIKTQNFLSFYHQQIQITSSDAFIVRQDGKETTYRKGQKVLFSAAKLSSGSKSITICPKESGKLKVLSLMRMDRHPSYRGKFRIIARKEGLLLINELPLEEYLYAVVSSEVSTSGPLETLKAQAVCARTYAANRLKASVYEKYGADIDDSDTCQVYNNFPEDQKSRRAVKETEGIVLKKDGRLIPVYYFEASWGYTASGKVVWNTEEEIPYLKRKFQIREDQDSTSKKSPDLSEEKAFRDFLDGDSVRTYDSDSPWYRWKIQISWRDLEEGIDGKVKNCYDAYSNLILYKKKSNGKFYKGAFRSIGELRKIYVGKRDKSGLAAELIIEGSKNTVKIRTQYSIRQVLNTSEEITLMNGKKHAAMSLLPSAAFYLEKAGSGRDAYLLIRGGGFGHGTGMSQWGARIQGEEGWSYEKILKYYFFGISVSGM